MARSSGSHHPYPRSARVNQILREVISDELTRISDVDDRIGILTVTGVQTTEDLRNATVFFDSLSPDARVALEERRAQLQSAVNVQTQIQANAETHLHGRSGRGERRGRRRDHSSSKP
jgi:ribosome-binding factor A